MAFPCDRDYQQFLNNPIKPPRFFKVVLDDGSRTEKIVIPRKFVLKYGENLTDSVSFKIPDGTTWRVDLVKTVNDVWLSKGWKEFSKHYSLQRGHFLVFEYDMSSCFKVGIFEPNSTEIEYPHQPINVEERLDLGRDQSPSLCDRCGCKRKRSDSEGQSESVTNSHKFRVLAKPLTQKERERALQRAREGFESNKPSFMVVMQPAYLHGKLRIPYSFAKRHLRDITGEVRLQFDGGQYQTVAFILYPEYSHASFNSGWPAFQREHNFKVGDVIIFELIDQTKSVYNVTISRAVEAVNREVIVDRRSEARGWFETGSSAIKHLRVDPDAESSKFARTVSAEDACQEPSDKNLGCRFGSRRARKLSDIPQQLTSKQREQAMKRAKAGFRSDKPLFRALIQPTYVYGNLRVSFQFAKKYLKEKSGQVILQIKGGKSRKINFFVRYDKSHASFNAGWSAFARENYLNVGDVLTFELIEKTKFVFNVTIFRAIEDARCKVEAGHGSKANGFRSGVSANTTLNVDYHAESDEAFPEEDSKNQVKIIWIID